MGSTPPSLEITDDALVALMVVGTGMSVYAGTTTITQVVSGSPLETLLDRLGVGLVPNSVASKGELAERMGVSVGEVGAIGTALLAAGGAGIAARQALKEIETRRAERAEMSPADRILALQALLTSIGPILEKGGEATKDLADGIAAIVQEALVVGSILPDDL